MNVWNFTGNLGRDAEVKHSKQDYEDQDRYMASMSEVMNTGNGGYRP